MAFSALASHQTKHPRLSAMARIWTRANKNIKMWAYADFKWYFTTKLLLYCTPREVSQILISFWKLYDSTSGTALIESWRISSNPSLCDKLFIKLSLCFYNEWESSYISNSVYRQNSVPLHRISYDWTHNFTYLRSSSPPQKYIYYSKLVVKWLEYLHVE